MKVVAISNEFGGVYHGGGLDPVADRPERHPVADEEAGDAGDREAQDGGVDEVGGR